MPTSPASSAVVAPAPHFEIIDGRVSFDSLSFGLGFAVISAPNERRAFAPYYYTSEFPPQCLENLGTHGSRNQLKAAADSITIWNLPMPVFSETFVKASDHIRKATSLVTHYRDGVTK